MSENIVITIALLLAMVLLSACSIALLLIVLHYNKIYNTKLNALRQAKAPDTFVLKSSTSSYLAAVVEIAIFTILLLIFRSLPITYTLLDAEGSEALFLFLAAGFFVAMLLVAVLNIVIALSGFTRKLQANQAQLTYRNWRGQTITFQATDIFRYTSAGIDQRVSDHRVLGGQHLQFVDSKGKKHFAIIYLSLPARILLSNYLSKYGAVGKQNEH